MARASSSRARVAALTTITAAVTLLENTEGGVTVELGAGLGLSSWTVVSGVLRSVMSSRMEAGEDTEAEPSLGSQDPVTVVMASSSSLSADTNVALSVIWANGEWEVFLSMFIGNK